MTQIIINIEDVSILPHLKKILNAINGVSIAKTEKKTSGIEEAYADIRAGRVKSAKNVDDMLNSVLGI